ncbi:MAG: DUF4340 domain-containing protein [Opitutaceae bacterium]|nr:DUF4340 domain-containing protein [Opitutaceae bacterium]
MRSKVTVVLLFLNVVLFAYIYYFEQVKPIDSAGKTVLGSEVASITAFTRSSPGAPDVRAELDPNRGNTWWLTAPYEWPANPNAIARILNELQLLKAETSFAVADIGRSNQTLASYGLEQPALTLTFHAAGKDYTLRIGDDTGIGNRLYVLSPDGSRIHVVSRSLAESLGLPLADLRAESIFTIPVFEVRSLNVQTPPPSNLKVRLRRDAAARWSFETPILARAGKSAVEVTINSLNALTARNFLSSHDTDLERSGLNAPALRVTLEGNARRETLLLGSASATAGEYYAKTEDRAVVFTTAVPASLLDVLRTAHETLRDTRILDFEPGTVTGLTIVAPGQPELTLQKLEAAAPAAGAKPGDTPARDGWQAVVRVSGQAPQTVAADPGVVTDLLQKLHQLAARKFLSDAPSLGELESWGFNRPDREITLRLSTGGGPRGTEPSTLTLRVGTSPDKPGEAFAVVTNAPFVYQIVPDLLDDTPSAALAYRLRLLRELPDGARITGLRLVELAGGAEVFGVTNDTALTPESLSGANLSPAARQALGALLGQLRTLSARRFTAETFSAEQADTADGPRPWKYRLDLTVAFAGGNGGGNGTSSLFLTDRLGGSTLLAGTADFGGVEFEVTQEMLDALFTLTYAERHDPGAPAGPAPAPAAPATPAAPPPETKP